MVLPETLHEQEARKPPEHEKHSFSIHTFLEFYCMWNCFCCQADFSHYLSMPFCLASSFICFSCFSCSFSLNLLHSL